MKRIIFFLLSSFFLFSCVPATGQSQTQIVTVYASSSAEPWLSKLFACANNFSVVLNINAETPEIYLRLGEPEMTAFPMYQIGEEEILIVTQRESIVQNLTLVQAQELFAQPASSTQIWVYPSDADLQILFDQLLMRERSVSSSARIAVSPHEMSNRLMSESNSVGILPRQSLTNNLRSVASAGVIPVLAITKLEPQAVIVNLISCLQSN